jgi:hypothetical protein
MLCSQNLKKTTPKFHFFELTTSFPLAFCCPHDCRGIVLDGRLSQIGDVGIGILCNPRMIWNLFQRQPLLRIMLQQLPPKVSTPRAKCRKGASTFVIKSLASALTKSGIFKSTLAILLYVAPYPLNSSNGGFPTKNS